MPDPGPLAAELAAIKERHEELRSRYGHVGGLLVLAKVQMDVPRLLAAVEALQDALLRHQHKLTDRRGDCCAGCLSDWPCPDSDVAARALLGEGESGG
jgi:hypothetical protein